MAIGEAVGNGGANMLADVLVVQHLLNGWLAAAGKPLLPTTGYCGGLTIAAITGYQAEILGFTRPDGLISPGGKTWQALASGQGATTLLSGAAWWRANQAKFPNSDRLGDLVHPFRERATLFVNALRSAGAQVTLSSTRRNATRAHLMHYCWCIARGEINPTAVPSRAGLSIRWDHGDATRSKQGAQEMVDLFGIAFKPSLTSLHIEGRAIDMTIRWSDKLVIRDSFGKKFTLTAPRSGEINADLHRIGASFGVFKLLSDPPHWSETGK